jgi:hypothetical protein
LLVSLGIDQAYSLACLIVVDDIPHPLTRYRFHIIQAGEANSVPRVAFRNVALGR